MSRATIIINSTAARHLDKTHSKQCEHCGGVFYRDKRCTWAHWERARLCSRQCVGLARAAKAKAARPSLRATFERKFRKTSGCWEWNGLRDKDGYGIIPYARKMLRAPKVSLELDGRPVPDGMYACHTCDNPSCVNPSHLYVGTPAQNSADAKRRRRLNPGRKAKLTPDDVAAIRADDRPNAEIAQSYGVSRSNVSLIKNRYTWEAIP